MRTAARLPLAGFLLLILTTAGLAQGPLLPTLPWIFHEAGPYVPASKEWNNGNVQVTNPTGGGMINVNHFGVVWFPDDGAGNILPPITPYPLVVFAHGRFHQAPYIGNNHKEATYLLKHLASWGFVVASVNLDVVGQYGSPAAIPQRGELINKTVEYFAAQPGYAPFLDLTNIVYIGHSRGGEGVFAAVQQNPAWIGSIRGIGAIAPTNFQGYTIAANAMVIYGSQDGDVNNGWPIELYGQTQTSGVKAFRYVEGANHFWFTDTINYFAETNAQLTRLQHHEISRTFWTTWCAFMCYADRPSYVRIAGDKEIQWSAAFKIHRIFHTPRQITVDHFENQPKNVTRNSLGGANTLTGLVNPQETFLSGNSYYNKSNALTATWASAAKYDADLPGGLDVLGYGYVSVNVAQKYASASNPAGQPQRFHISITDINGNTAKLDNTDIAAWPYPFTTNPNGPVKSVLKSFRFPLTAFTAQTPQIDLTKLKRVIVDFDVTATGEFALDDVTFTQ
jgi:hypothetical protein